MPTTYRAYDFTIQTPFTCPELLPGDADPLILAEYGHVPDTLPAPRQVGGIFEARQGLFLFKLPEVARYLVEEGQRIVIDPAPGADERDVRLFLLSTCLTVILLQRGGCLPLHASAVGLGQGAALFLGYSGAGKSTLLAALLERGYSMLSDDVAPVRLSVRPSVRLPVHLNDAGGVHVQPSFPYLKLTGEAARGLGRSTDELALIRRDARVDKYGLEIPAFSHEPQPVRAVYVLVPTEKSDITLTRLETPRRLQTLLYRTAGMPFMDGLGLRAAHFQLAAALADRMPVTRVQRPRHGGSVQDLADVIEADLN